MFVCVKVVSIWSGLTPLELVTHAIFACIFSVLLVLKLDHFVGFHLVSWQRIFVPLFIAQALNAYFVTIVFIRSLVSGEMKKKALGHIGWTFALLSAMTTTEVWLSRRLDNEIDWSYAAIFTPIYLLLPIRMMCSR